MMAEMVSNIEEENTTTEEPTPIVETIFDNPPKIDVKIRKGEYIIKIPNTGTDKTNIESCLETAMKKIVLLAFKNGTKTKKKRKTIVDMTPEQIEKARIQRLEWYRKNKENVRVYVKEKYNNDYLFWKQLLTTKEKDTDYPE